MEEVKAVVKCGNCQTVLKERTDIAPADRNPCPNCGSMARAFEVSLHASITFKGKLTAKGKRAGAKKHFVIQVMGDDFFRKMKKWTKLSRVIDREHDSYREIFTDPDTGQTIHKCVEPLSQHTGHGSAKAKENKS